MLLLGGLTAFAPLSVDMYLPAFPALARHFAARPGEVQGTLATFLLFFALGQGVVGPLSDRYGRRPPLLLGLALFVLASLACGLAGSIGVLTVARLFQGLGACAGMVIARAVVRDLFEAREAARFFATLMLVTGLAPMLAPLLGGVLLLRYGWESIFWLLAGLGLAGLAATMAWLPETRPAGAPRHGPLGALRTYRDLLSDARFTSTAGISALGMGGLFAYIAGSPFVFIELLGVAEDRYGALFGLNALGMVGCAQLGARLVDRLGPARLLRGATLAMALAGTALVAAALAGTASVWWTASPLFLYVAALGIVLPNAAALALAPFRERAGTASAMMGMLQFGAGAAVAAMLGAVGAASALPMALAVAGSGVAATLLARRLR